MCPVAEIQHQHMEIDGDIQQDIDLDDDEYVDDVVGENQERVPCGCLGSLIGAIMPGGLLANMQIPQVTEPVEEPGDGVDPEQHENGRTEEVMEID